MRPTLLRRTVWEGAPEQFARDAAGIEPDPWQVAVWRDRRRRVLANLARQSGKTTAACLLAAHVAAFTPRSLTLCASPSDRQSKELTRRIREILQASEVFPGTWPCDNVHEIELPNGSRILSLPDSEDTVRVYSAPALILIDEASRVSDDLFLALGPMQATNYRTGRLWAMSTPWGRRGWWWREWETGGEEWTRVRIPATECPRMDAAFLATEQRKYGPLRFRSEYLCEFADTEQTLFPAALLDRMFRSSAPPLFPMAPSVPSFARVRDSDAPPLFGGVA